MVLTRCIIPAMAEAGAMRSFPAFDPRAATSADDRDPVPLRGRGHPLCQLTTTGPRQRVAPTSPTYRDALADGVMPSGGLRRHRRRRWRNSATGALSDLGRAGARAGRRRRAVGRGSGLAGGVGSGRPVDPSRHRAADPGSPRPANGGQTDAAGLLLASDQDAARAYAGIIEEVAGAARWWRVRRP